MHLKGKSLGDAVFLDKDHSFLLCETVTWNPNYFLCHRQWCSCLFFQSSGGVGVGDGGFKMYKNKKQNPLWSAPTSKNEGWWEKWLSALSNSVRVYVMHMHQHTQSKSFISYTLLFNTENDCLPSFLFFVFFF